MQTMFPRRIDTVLFDLDGTLIDSYEAYYEIARQTCETIRHPMLEKKQLDLILYEGQSFVDLCFPHHTPQREKKIEAYKKESEKIWPRVFRKHARWYPEAEPVLAFLKDRRYKTAIVTNSHSSVLQMLDNRQLLRSFDALITSDRVQNKKPHPESVEEALQTLASTPKQALMVGDTPLDIRAGKAAGTYTMGIALTSGAKRRLKKEAPDVIVRSLSELPNLLSATP